MGYLSPRTEIKVVSIGDNFDEGGFGEKRIKLVKRGDILRASTIDAWLRLIWTILFPNSLCVLNLELAKRRRNQHFNLRGSVRGCEL